MPRPEKVAAVDDIKERFERAQAVFLAEYAGLSVKAQQQLRRGLRESGAEFKVIKMTLTRRAAADLDIDELDELLIGPTGVAFADGDPVAAAKVLKQFASENEVFTLKGGLLGRDVLSPERISQLAEIEPREVLLAKIAGAMKAPMSAMAGLLNALPRNMASNLGQLLEKKESGEIASPADAPTEEPAAEAATEAPADAADETSEEAVVATAAEDAPDATDEAPQDAVSEESAEASADASDDTADESADAAEVSTDEPAATAEEE